MDLNLWFIAFKRNPQNKMILQHCFPDLKYKRKINNAASVEKELTCKAGKNGGSSGLSSTGDIGGVSAR